MKIVVFDLDETLGYFTQYGIFWDSLLHYLKIKQKTINLQLYFDNTLDLFPEFLRPNIINILNYLKNKKLSACCNKMMIYTNNNGSREWARHIIEYFEKKINFKIIDQIILAFKIKGKIIEMCRTTHNKTHNDLVRCTKIPHNSEICFLDDTFYPEMTNDNIYYINVKPYYHDLRFDYMLKKFKESEFSKKILDNDDDFESIMMEHIELYKYDCIDKDPNEYNIDKIVGKHIINHLDEFFNKKKNKTIKNRTKRFFKYNKTRKNR
jgi:hypothetical protein